MLEELAVKKTPQHKQPINLPRVALRFLPRERKDFEALFGVPDLPLARQYLREQLSHRGFRDEVLNALDVAPRHVFLDARTSSLAYVDTSVLSQHMFVQAPSLVATVVSTLPSPDARVLELGTGTGYQAAVLAAFGAQVTTIDTNDMRQEAARERFAKLDLTINAVVRTFDPIENEHSLYDLIVVSEALNRMPHRLIRLVRSGGSIIAPIVLADSTLRLTRYVCDAIGLTTVDLGPCFALASRRAERGRRNGRR